MDSKRRSYLALVEALIVFGVLVGLSLTTPYLPVSLPLWILYGLLIVFTMTFAVPIGGGYVSLLPMASVAAYLTMGLIPTGWAAFVGSLAHGWLRLRSNWALEKRQEKIERAGLAAANVASLIAYSLAQARERLEWRVKELGSLQAVGQALSASLPPIQADAEKISRVLYNLLDNALKYTPDGGRVRLWAYPDPEHEPPALLVGVSDTGPGIPAEAQARLFKKFQRITATRGRRRGSGLGLHYCKLAVEAHGGNIWMESRAGEGSTFVFRLPLKED